VLPRPTGSLGSIPHIVLAHIERHDFALGHQQVQRDAILEIDRHRVRAPATARRAVVVLRPGLFKETVPRTAMVIGASNPREKRDWFLQYRWKVGASTRAY
jgi:hypothetical protein